MAIKYVQKNTTNVTSLFAAAFLAINLITYLSVDRKKQPDKREPITVSRPMSRRTETVFRSCAKSKSSLKHDSLELL